MAFWSKLKGALSSSDKEKPPGAGDSATPDTGKHILIVEDSQLESRFLETLLKKNGYRITCAKEAAEGMEACSNERPDLIILDINLPAGDPFSVTWDGRKFMYWLRQQSRHYPPVIVVTGDSQVKEEEMVKMGVKAFFKKPVAPAELLEKIKELLDGSPGVIPA